MSSNQHFSDELSSDSAVHFRRMVESVGVKRFSGVMGLSTRQINRMLSGAQPNPVERIVRCLQSCEPQIGDDALGYICQEAGGFFVKGEPEIGRASVNAVKECAEAIAAIADGVVTKVDEREVREAISALTGLLQASGTEQPTARTPAPAPVLATHLSSNGPARSEYAQVATRRVSALGGSPATA